MQTIEPEMISHDYGDARAVILNAARAVAAREGVPNLTLGKVAAEASLPRPVVYGQFVRKDDLLLCVAADSLEILARRMGGIEDLPKKSENSASQEGAVILTLARSEQSLDAPEMGAEAASEVRAAVGSSSEYSAIVSGRERRQARRIDVARLLEKHGRIAAADKPTDVDDGHHEASTNEHGTDRAARSPDAWLERRLRVFEHAMTAMQTRQEQVEKESRDLVVSAENSIKAVQGTLTELVARMDEAEARQKAAADEIRVALNEANLRIQTVEGVAHAALAENGSTLPVFTPVEPSVPFQPGKVRTYEDSENVAHTATDKSFLNAARASAIAAAAVRAESNDSVDVSEIPNMRVRYLQIGLLVGAVFIAAAILAFSQGVRDGRREALNRATASNSQTSIVALDVSAPLDKLTHLAESGDAKAEIEIANRYLKGTSTQRDDAAGFRWMTRAARQGNAVAQYLLGSLYQKGTGTAVNPVQAAHWYQVSALQGNRKAMHALAIVYAEGLVGMKNESEAARWFARAANLGYVDSQFDLAVLYERGDGVPQSLVNAYKWYAIAGAQGDSEAQSRIDALRTQLSHHDLAKAQRAADAFRSKQYDRVANLSPKT